MELSQQLACQETQIRVMADKGRATTQVTLDDDYNLADYKPDILKLIEEKGQVRIDEVKALKSQVQVRGTLQFEVLYRSAREDGFVSSLKGELPFQETVRMDEAQEYDTVFLVPELEDLSVGLINSRKLEIRALITLQLQLMEPVTHHLTCGLEGDYGEDVQQKTSCIQALELMEQKKDTSRFHSELTLPSNKPNVQEIIWYSSQLRGLESRLTEGKLQLTGELLIHMVYRSFEESQQMQCLELAVPMQTELAVPEADEDMISWIRVRMLTGELEAMEDFDGEQRVLNLETVLEVDMTFWQERELCLLQDAYALGHELTTGTKEVSLPQLLVKNDSRFRMNERIELPEEARVLQICSSTGSVQIEEITPADGHLEVDGILKLKLLYVAADDDLPLVAVSETLPFHEIIEAPGLLPDKGNYTYELEPGIDLLTTMLLDQKQIECKAQIRLCAAVFENHPVMTIEHLQMEPMDREKLQSRPGIIGYIVKEGENLWQIAKAHGVTVSQIMEQNNLADDTVKAGDKLMIVHTIG
ncbi:MAG: DUF3794 domain-containing protein [bacterium]|nr:DUF3794 domain-containing protein [bacterium]